MRINALDRHAHLAAVHEAGEEQRLGDGARVGVIKNDRRIVAAEFQRDALERLRSGRQDLLAGGHRARERNLVDVRVLGHPLPQVVARRQHVDHAGRKDRLRQLAHPERGQRSIGRRFEDHRVAGVERRAQRPQRQRGRRIPGRDDGDDAQRPVVQFDAAVVVFKQNLDRDFDARHAVGLGGSPLELRHRLADGLALLARQQRTQFVLVLAQEHGILPDQLCALFEGSRAPPAGRPPGCPYRLLQVFAARGRGNRKYLFRRRIDHLHDLVAGHELTVDRQRKISLIIQCGSTLGHQIPPKPSPKAPSERRFYTGGRDRDLRKS